LYYINKRPICLRLFQIHKSVNMQIAYLFTLILFVHSQETPSTENVKRRKQDFYCSGIHKEKQLD